MHLHLPSRYFDPVLSGLLRIILPYFGISFNWKINTNVPMKYCNYSFCYYNPMKHGKSGLDVRKKLSIGPTRLVYPKLTSSAKF